MASNYTATHPEYDAQIAIWQKCRDAFEGEEVIKSKGTKYLPKLKGQVNEDYRAYVDRALFYSITSKSISALTGMATSKPVDIKCSESMRQYLDDTSRMQFSEIFALTLTEILLQGRDGTLIDFPKTGGDPYIVKYNAESIINWRYDVNNQLALVVLKEQYTHYIDDYESELRYRYRELRLEYGEYSQIIHYEDDENLTEYITPRVKGKSLDFIPFFVTHPLGMGLKMAKPPVLDIVNINLSHYRSSADLEHGRHFTGLPTPVIIGGNAGDDLYIGSSKFIIIPDKGGDAKYLEYTGLGLQSLEKALVEKQGQLASLSARFLDNSTRGSEAADTVKLRYMSETASLTNVILAVNVMLQTVYNKIAEFRGESEPVTIKIDTNFLETALSAADMTALFKGYFDGVISKETLVYNLRRGQRLDPNRSDEDEINSINKQQSGDLSGT